MLQERSDMHEHSVAAADNKRNIRFELREIRGGRIATNPRRIEVRLVMMNAKKWPSQCEGHSLSGPKANHQRAWKTRALSGADGLELVRRHFRVAQRGMSNRH